MCERAPHACKALTCESQQRFELNSTVRERGALLLGEVGRPESAPPALLPRFFGFLRSSGTIVLSASWRVRTVSCSHLRLSERRVMKVDPS